MKKRMKRALSLLLAAALSLSLLVPGAFAADSAAESGITVYLSLAKDGAFAGGKNSTGIACVPVEIKKASATIDDAFSALHEQYYAGESSEPYQITETGWITSFWGDSTSIGYYLNHASAWSADDAVHDGDLLDVFFYSDTDTTSWSDCYTYFTETEKTVKVGTDASFTLMSASWTGDSAVDGTNESTYLTLNTVNTDGSLSTALEDSLSVGSDGTFTYAFTTTGTYLLTFNGYVSGNVAVPTICKVTVLSEEDYGNYAVLEAAKKQLTWETLSSEEANAVTVAPTLPGTLTVEGKEVSVSWACDDTTGALSVSTWGAYVDRPAKDDVSCTLTATLTYNGATATKTFPVTVKAEGVTSDKTSVVKFGDLMKQIAENYADDNGGGWAVTSAIANSDLPWAVIDTKAYGTTLGAEMSDYSTALESNKNVAKYILAEIALGHTVGEIDVSTDADIYAAPYHLLARYANGTTASADNQQLIACMVNYLNAPDAYATADTIGAALAGIAPYNNADDPAVQAAVTAGIEWLSTHQNDDGTFSAYGVPTAESTAMAIVALSSVGVDAHTDSRFVKNYKSAVEGLLTFALSDNSGFGHKGNVTYNAMATEQGFRALVSYARFKETGSAYNIYLQAKDSTSAVSAPNISATVKPSGNPGSSTRQITVSASVTALGETWASGSYSVKDGTSVSAVLKKLFAANGITCVGMDRGYISSVTHGDVTLAEKDHGNNSGWMYRVNGVLPNETVNDYALHDGDEISFFYVTDYTKVDTPSAPTEDATEATVKTNADGSFTVTLPKNGTGAAVVALPGAKEGQVPFIVGSDGTRRAVRRSAMIGGTLYVLLDESCTIELMDNDAAFADVKDDAWYAEAVAFVAGCGLYNGTGAQTFDPYAPMSRAMLAVVLYRLENEPAAAADALKNFADGAAVAPWAEDGLSWAVAQNVMAGSGGALFANDTITREQLIVMLWRYAALCGMDTETDGVEALADQGVSDWAEAAVMWAVQEGILLGDESGALHPQSEASRAEVAVILMRFIALMVQ